MFQYLKNKYMPKKKKFEKIKWIKKIKKMKYIFANSLKTPTKDEKIKIQNV